MNQGSRRFSRAIAVLGLPLVLLLCCSQDRSSTEGKIPITTSSEAAHAAFLQGRDLAEKLRRSESRRFFKEAVAEDPNFALAHLALSRNAPTRAAYFESLDRAVALAGEVSPGERLMIMAVDAEARGDDAGQLERLLRLVRDYPNDERAHRRLGSYYSNNQDFEKALGRYEAAIRINPGFAMAFNGLGYANRWLGRYEDAEKAFLAYIALIPEEPNPYDSYAELLMKMGRFEESIARYREALSFNSNFWSSHVGIGYNLLLLDRPKQALEQFRRLLEIARDDGERRQALRWLAASWLDLGDPVRALELVGRSADIAEVGKDVVASSQDLVLAGDIRLHTGDPEGALEAYHDAVAVVEAADLLEGAKERTRRDHLFREGLVALAREDFESARARTWEYGDLVAVHQIPLERRRVHELRGRIALGTDNPEEAVDELEQADQRDPSVLLALAQAWERRGDRARAREFADRAANFNELSFTSAYVRTPARELLEDLR